MNWKYVFNILVSQIMFFSINGQPNMDLLFEKFLQYNGRNSAKLRGANNINAHDPSGLPVMYTMFKDIMEWASNNQYVLKNTLSSKPATNKVKINNNVAKKVAPQVKPPSSSNQNFPKFVENYNIPNYQNPLPNSQISLADQIRLRTEQKLQQTSSNLVPSYQEPSLPATTVNANQNINNQRYRPNVGAPIKNGDFVNTNFGERQGSVGRNTGTNNQNYPNPFNIETSAWNKNNAASATNQQQVPSLDAYILKMAKKVLSTQTGNAQILNPQFQSTTPIPNKVTTSIPITPKTVNGANTYPFGLGGNVDLLQFAQHMWNANSQGTKTNGPASTGSQGTSKNGQTSTGPTKAVGMNRNTQKATRNNPWAPVNNGGASSNIPGAGGKIPGTIRNTPGMSSKLPGVNGNTQKATRNNPWAPVNNGGASSNTPGAGGKRPGTIRNTPGMSSKLPGVNGNTQTPSRFSNNYEQMRTLLQMMAPLEYMVQTPIGSIVMERLEMISPTVQHLRRESANVEIFMEKSTKSGKGLFAIDGGQTCWIGVNSENVPFLSNVKNISMTAQPGQIIQSKPLMIVATEVERVPMATFLGLSFRLANECEGRKIVYIKPTSPGSQFPFSGTYPPALGQRCFETAAANYCIKLTLPAVRVPANPEVPIPAA